MKTKNKKLEKLFSFLLLAGLLVHADIVYSQTVCTDNTNIVYGLTVSGGLYPVNINTAVVGSQIESLTDGINPAVNANAIGYNSVNGKFYYFYRTSASPTAPFSEFVSYNPATNTLQVLATPPFGTTTKVRSGCVNNLGNGYYCIDIISGVCSLWYYNINTNTWTKISSSFKNGANDYTASFVSLNSGDMAFDSGGNLWMILSNTHNYAMYRIVDPVPTTAQTSVTVEQLIPQIALPIDGAGFTGLAFNANGYVFLTTSSGTTAGHNLLYKMTNVASGITYVDSLTLGGTGDDLTSCTFTYVLPLRWLGFTTDFIKQKGVQLKWDVTEDDNIRQYYVERSTDAKKWERIASIQKGIHPYAPHTQYDYTDKDYQPGKIFYRIIGEDMYGETLTSAVKQMIVEEQGLIISPNPAKDILIIKQKIARACQLDIYDSFGKLMLSTKIKNSTETINISKLFKGNYFLKLSIDGAETVHSSFIKL